MRQKLSYFGAAVTLSIIVLVITAFVSVDLREPQLTWLGALGLVALIHGICFMLSRSHSRH